MVESVRGRNKEQRARLLLGYQVADSVSKLHPLIHPRIWYLSSMGRKILPLIADFEPKNSCGVGWGELAGFLDNRGSGCCWRVSSRPDRQSEPDLRPQDSSPSQSPSCSSTRFVRKEKIFLIRFIDCCHAKQLRGLIVSPGLTMSPLTIEGIRESLALGQNSCSGSLSPSAATAPQSSESTLQATQ